MNKDVVLVTGAGGNVGREVVRELAARGVSYRAAVVNDLDTARVPDGGGELVRFDFTDPATYGPAFDGISKVFLVRPPAISKINRDMKPAIDYAVAAGVKHVVFLSLLGAEKIRVVPHVKVEKLLTASGIATTQSGDQAPETCRSTLGVPSIPGQDGRHGETKAFIKRPRYAFCVQCSSDNCAARASHTARSSSRL